MENETFKIRDRREKGWFIIDNDYLNEYAKIFGPMGTAIYVSLCRHANISTQSCWPSQQTIAKENRISERTVRNLIKQFEGWNLIKVTRKIDGRTRRKKNNIYHLMDKSVWKKPVKISQGHFVPLEPEANEDANQRHVKTESACSQLPIKETNKNKENKIKETQLEECCFENFWNEYPVHAKKKATESKWGKLSHELQSRIIEDVKKRKIEHGQWLRGFISHPTNYLDNEEWNDDIAPMKKKGYICDYGHLHPYGQECGHKLQRVYESSPYAKKLSTKFRVIPP
jgi:hypothetical protein